MTKEILIRDRKVVYELTYKNVKNINIRIKADKIIRISACKFVSAEYIENLLDSKADAIFKALDKIEKSADLKNARHGRDNIVYYLGNPFTLQINKTADKNYVEIKDNFINVYCTDKKSADVVLDNWYSSRCTEIFDTIGERVYRLYSGYISHKPQFNYKLMKSLWGSCNPSKLKITINKELIKYDQKLIEYVFFHEFTHFIHPDHSSKFYEFMSCMLPEHRKLQAELKEASNIIKYS